jgi:hypothetical protein
MKLLQDVAELRVLADDPGRAPALGHFLLQENVFGHHPALRDRTFDHQQQVIGIDRLGQEVGRPLPHRRHRVLDASIGRHDDDRELGIEFLRGTQNAKPVAGWKFQIREDDSGARLAELVNRFCLVACFKNDVPLRLEGVTQHGAQ